MGGLAWAEIRRRWKGAAVVGLVLGLGFAAVLAAAAGARRTETAFPRLLASAHSSELLVSADERDAADRHRFYEQVADLDGVERTSLVAGLPLVPVDVPDGEGTSIEACTMASLDGVMGYDLSRPNLVAGRMPARDRADEVLITHTFADAFGVGVGDDLDIVVGPEDESVVVGEVTAEDGPIAHATVVGVGVPITSVVPLSDLDRAPSMIASPAFVEEHAPDPGRWCWDLAAVRLEPGTDVDQISAAISDLGEPHGGALIQDLTANYDEVGRSTQPQVSSLWLFAAAAGAATVLVVTQLLGRQLRESASTSIPVWRAVGVTRQKMRVLVAAPSVVAGTVGAGVAVVGAVLVSGRFPVGPARLAEPDPGMAAHAGIHFGGALVVMAGAIVIGAATAALAVRARRQPERLRWLARVSGASSQPGLVVGMHLASGSGRGSNAVPVRSSAAGVALTIAAVAATVTFAGGLDDLVTTPSRYGRDWDMMIDGDFGPTPVPKIVDELGDDPAVAAIAAGRYGEVTIDGRRVPTVGLVDLVGTTFPAIIEGRTPSRGDEIVIGTRSLADLERSVGDTVMVDTGAGPSEMTVVGTAAFPRLNRGSFSTLGLGVGAMARADAFPPLEVPSRPPPGIDLDDYLAADGALFEFATIRLHDDVAQAARERVATQASGIANEARGSFRTEQRPIAIDNYASVRSTPALLALLLGAMAAATLAHLVVSVVRQRRRDLALCTALGMRRGQIMRAVVVNAVLIAGAALLIGLPLGLAAGRLAWSGFASDLGVVDALTFPIGAIAVAVPLVIVAAVAVSAVPAFLASRTRPALVLRTE